MRYISAYESLSLITKTQNIIPPTNDPNPIVKYQFTRTGLGYGVLIIGDPTQGGAGNEIDATDLMEIYPDGGTAIEKAGLNKIFWESPEITSSGTLSTSTWYEVLRGSVTYNGKTYTEGEKFKTDTTTSFTGNGVVALAIDNFDVTSSEAGLNLRRYWYYVNNLSSYADEAVWDEGNWRGTTRPDAWTWVRT